MDKSWQTVIMLLSLLFFVLGDSMSTALVCWKFGPAAEKNGIMAPVVELGWSLGELAGLPGLGVFVVLMLVKVIGLLGICWLLMKLARLLGQREELGQAVALGVSGIMGLGLTAGNMMAFIGVLQV